MKRLLILLSFCGMLLSCYKDKGNYDIKDINDFSISIFPQSPNVENLYTVNQPAQDTASYEFRADVTQSAHLDGANLEYTWYRSFSVDGKTVVDTLHTANIMLKFPPLKKSGYSMTCKVTDRTTDISYYKYMTVKTKVPYVNSWIFLHGEDGDRRLGALEFDESGNTQWSDDIYMGLLGKRRFQSFSVLMYSPLSSNWSKPERLFVASKDSCVTLHPFDLSLVSPLNTMMPAGVGNPKVAFTMSSDAQLYTSFVDINGKFFNGKFGGFFYYTPFEVGLENYKVDKGYISYNGNATLWDNTAKRLMYYQSGMNYYGRDGVRNDAGITEKLKEVPEVVLSKSELANKTVLWLGRGTASTDEDESAMLVAKDGSGYCYLYYVSYTEDDSGSGSVVQVRKVLLGKRDFNENTKFASSNAYNDQLFYTKGEDLFLLNINSGTESLVHAAGGVIKNMKFRLHNYHYLGIEDAKVLGIAVSKGNRMEFHEITMTSAGDVRKAIIIADGIKEISDFIFTHIQRRIL